jgi:hypothetical protein
LDAGANPQTCTMLGQTRERLQSTGRQSSTGCPLEALDRVFTHQEKDNTTAAKILQGRLPTTYTTLDRFG